MMFATYEYYSQTYHGRLSEADYNAHVVKAHAEIVTQTFGRTSDDMTENLKLCECELVDVMHSFAQAPTGVASVSNDGYSVNFGGSSNEQRGQPREVLAVCKKHLTCPVNLMYRGCG